MNRIHAKRRGLVLLVVLGMLALFSLLTVTYVVFAGQSKSTNVALSRRFVQDRSYRPVFEEAIKQLIRGTADSTSDLFGKSMLDDLYGANETFTLQATGGGTFRARTTRLGGSPMTHEWDCLQRPMLLGTRFLRIPLDTTFGSTVPAEDDVYNGRLVTFPEGQGPLSGLSFHIVRYVGDHTSDGNASVAACSYSITIDLLENDLSGIHSQIVGGGPSPSPMTGTIADWAAKYPQMVSSPFSDIWARGVYLCYATVGLNPAVPVLLDPYSFFINAVPLNSHGVGVLADGSNQYHVLDTSYPAALSSSINVVSTGLQPRANALSISGTLLDPDGNVSTGGAKYGDTDEPIDSADFNTEFLALRPASAANSGDIIPSFHRTALLNYLVNFKNPNDYTELEFWAVLRRIELATMRPLALDIVTPSGIPAFMNPAKVQTILGVPHYVTHPNFNPNSASITDPVAPNGKNGIPPLVISIGSGSWTTAWQTPAGVGAFRAWLDALMVGKWDVDNLASGIPDSVFVDAGLPLQSTPDGQLLKALVAYYVECMDSKLDVNAAGSMPQANMFGNTNLFAVPTALPPGNLVGSPSPFAKGNVDSSGGSLYLPQGQGYGSADISLRHMFGKPGLAWAGINPATSSWAWLSGIDYAELAYRNLLTERYQTAPGTSGSDALTHLTFREVAAVHKHGGLPGLPLSIRGRATIDLDRLGNPFIHNYGIPNALVENEYEARLISAPMQDMPYTLAELERIYRIGDADHGALPDRLQKAMGESDMSLATSMLRHEITTRSRHLLVPKLAARNAVFKGGSDLGALNLGNVIQPPKSFFDLITTIQVLKGVPGANQLTFNQFQSLFPLEFHRNHAFNLNRPFGNGVDDDGDGQVDEPEELVGLQDPTDSGYYEHPRDAAGPTSIGTSGLYNDVLAGLNRFQWNLDPATGSILPNTPASIYLGQESRQLFARHLYCLAQLLVPGEYNFPSVEHGYWQDLLSAVRGGDVAATQKFIQIRGRILAQWAVNVVDYRDADAVMTRFPYDPDPFDRLNQLLAAAGGTYSNSVGIGWRPDRDLSVDTSPPSTPIAPSIAPVMYVAWGMEQPELLMTESLAFHDVRVRKDPDATPTRYDQFRIPQGSLFLEFYVPRTTETGAAAATSTQLPGVPTSLYTTNGSGDVVLDVGRLTPSTVGGYTGQTRYPVWRVYVGGSINKTSLTQSVGNRTPNQRLTKAVATDRNGTTRFDLSYQMPSTNWTGGTGTWNANGLAFDTTVDHNQAIPEPDTMTSRVILFSQPAATDNASLLAITPGIQNGAQVFYNQSGAVSVAGNQYFVVGPRATTYLGSKESSRTKQSGDPGNDPNDHLINLTPTWAQLYDANGTQFRNGTNVRAAVTMVAGANPPTTTWPGGGSIGINVSEPLPISGQYYDEPTDKINTSDNGANGFDNLPADGYHDYGTAAPATKLAPFDTGTNGPLRNWDKNFSDPNDTTALNIATINSSSDPIVQAGTALDWSTAYLQRLSDPEKPWHEILNPYITVDWIPIDLTVFSGEEIDSDLYGSAPTGVRLASRQKSGQMVSPKDMSIGSSTTTGLTFLSPVTHAPRLTTRDTTLSSFLRYQIKGEANDTDAVGTDPRPSTCDTQFQASDSESFATLAYLNSPYVLAVEPGLANQPALPAVYTGAPGDPAKMNPNWFPANVFWANRSFVNGFEMAYVPVSAPGQIGQEFTAATTSAGTDSIYASAYRTVDSNGYPVDPRMPSSIYAPAVPDESSAPQPHVANSEWSPTPPPGMQPEWTQTSRPPATNGTVNAAAYYPFAHLLNFFQEMPELSYSPQKYRNTNNFNRQEQFRHRHPKDTSLALLFDMVETPSAWGDVENYEPTSTFAYIDTTSMAQEYATVANASNIIFAPFKAPFNKLPRDVEPGRVNINTMTESSVFQGLVSNSMHRPTDIDFFPYDLDPNLNTSSTNDVDHNFDNIEQPGDRTTYRAPNALWSTFIASRQGYAGLTGAFYDPPNASGTFDPNLPTRSFNPHFPTHFAGQFKPVSEAGMVPQTRSLIGMPALPVIDSTTADQLGLFVHGRDNGMLDFFTRNNPTHTTLMRAGATVVDPNRTLSAFTGTAMPTGLHQPTNTPLLDVGNNQRHPFADLYPISRLQKLVTERSNVFAVYTTIALFEYDPASGNIGKEYGIDSGQAERFKAFYLIDRSIPVGFRIGEDHNVEDTILVRRILSE